VAINGKGVPFSAINSTIELNPAHGSESRIEIYHTGGICALPEQQDLLPGDSSSGYRIISEELKGKNYTIRLNGRSGSDADFKLYAPDGFQETPSSCTLLSQSGSLYSFAYRFPDAGGNYVTTPLIFIIR
jgi:hypothetical protein